MSRTIIAQRLSTKEIVSLDVPLTDGSTVRELSGPGGIYGKIKHVDLSLLGDDGQPIFEEWATALYRDDGDGTLRGGIITRIVEEDDGSLTVEAPGFTTYPHGIPYLGRYRPGLGADPLDTVREIWRHVQSFPDADLGVTVDSTTSRASLDDTTGDKPKPYTLSWWDLKDCGQEIDAMLDVAPADYTDTHQWNADHTEILHHVHLGVPRLGRRRDDLRFVEGENVVKALPRESDGDEFAQTIIGIGKGEGRKMVRHDVATRDHRLRRVAVVADKGATGARIAALARREHRRRTDTGSFSTVTIRDHLNARLSAIHPGDDIEVEANLRWYGRTRQWVRVLSITEPIDDTDLAVLNVARSSRYSN